MISWQLRSFISISLLRLAASAAVLNTRQTSSDREISCELSAPAGSEDSNLFGYGLRLYSLNQTTAPLNPLGEIVSLFSTPMYNVLVAGGARWGNIFSFVQCT